MAPSVGTLVPAPPLGGSVTRHTKIVATLGPASAGAGILGAMIDAGLDVARLNTSHGMVEEHERNVSLIREVANERGKALGVLMDLGGPKLRTGPTDGGRPLNLVAGDIIYITPHPVKGDESRLTIDYPNLLQDVRESDIILLDDGRIELEVLKVEEESLRCRVTYGGLLAPNKGVAFPYSHLTLPPLTDRDREAIAAGARAGVDFFALSFVREADDIELARSIIDSCGADIPIVAKIERRQAIQHLDDIVAAADGVMVARGDLGVDLAPEEVPIQQRRIIEAAARNKVPVITATQMLESMIDSARPSRAEASDVANAVWDLSDALMLSAETAVGRFPVESIAMMDRIIRRAEGVAPAGGYMAAPFVPDDHSYAVALAARTIVDTDHDLRAVVCFTNSGYSAVLMSKAYPGVPIFALSPSEPVVRRLALSRSVTPILGPQVRSIEDMFDAVDRLLMERRLVSRGDEVLITGSVPVNRAGTTNFLKLHVVGETGQDGQQYK